MYILYVLLTVFKNHFKTFSDLTKKGSEIYNLETSTLEDFSQSQNRIASFSRKYYIEPHAFDVTIVFC